MNQTIFAEPTPEFSPTKTKKAVPRKDDILWKSLLEDLFEDFLCFLMPDAAQQFDFSKGFVFLNQELDQLFPPENEEYSPKVVDKLVKVYRADGSEEWILVHIEVQGQHKKEFAQRMFTYFYRVYDKYRKPIVAYAVLTEQVFKARDNFFHLFCNGTELKYSYNILKIAQQKDEELLANPNPFAIVVLIAKAALLGKKAKKDDHEVFLLKTKLELARQLLTRTMPKSKIRALMNFLRYYIRFSLPENNTIFDKELANITKRTTTMGIEEFLLDRAKKEGIKEGRHAVIENLIVKLGLSNEQAADVADVSINFVQKIREQLEAKK